MGEARIKQANELKFTRSGSYPLMNIAEDYKLPYEVVLNFADAQKSAMIAMNRDPDAPGAFTVWQTWALDEVQTRLQPYGLQRVHRFFQAVINQQADFLLLRGDISSEVARLYRI